MWIAADINQYRSILYIILLLVVFVFMIPGAQVFLESVFRSRAKRAVFSAETLQFS